MGHRVFLALRTFVSAGTERLPPAQARHARITNALLLTYPALLVPYIPFYLHIGHPMVALALTVVCAGYAAGLAVNRRGTYRALVFVRALFMTDYALGAGLFSGVLGHGTGIHTLLYVGACLPFLICDLRERKLVGYSIAVAVLMLFAVELGRDALFPHAILDPGIQRVLYAFLIPSTFATLLAAVIVFARASSRAEAQAAARHQQIKRLLDTIDQGLLTVDHDGAIGSEHSTILESWFGPLASGQRVWNYLGGHDPAIEATLELGWLQLSAEVLPLVVALEQLPKQIAIGERTVTLAYKPIETESAAPRISIIVTDVTESLARARSELIQRETMVLFEELTRARGPFLEFFEEASSLVRQIGRDDVDPPTMFRLVHTLKGNCGMFGVESVAGVCHEVESSLADRIGVPPPAERARIAEAWNDLATRMAGFLGGAADRLDVERREYEDLCGAVGRRVDHAELARMLASWRLERVEDRLDRLAEHARSLAARRGKGEIEVEVAGGGVRIDGGSWAPFWAALVHAIRNSVEHGLEAPEDRLASGKPAAGKLELSATLGGGSILVTVRDDGRGIDWEAVEKKARARGLPHTTEADRIAALFADGFSTRDDVSMFSGRGVGMAALRDSCAALGGTIEVTSERGKGTCLTFRLPDRVPVGSPSHAPHAPL